MCRHPAQRRIAAKDARALQAGARGLQHRGVHGAGGGPGDDRQVAEDAVEVDAVGGDEQVRQQVQALWLPVRLHWVWYLH